MAKKGVVPEPFLAKPEISADLFRAREMDKRSRFEADSLRQQRGHGLTAAMATNRSAEVHEHVELLPLTGPRDGQ